MIERTSETILGPASGGANLSPGSGGTLRFGPYRFVAGDGLWRHGEPVALPPRAMAVLTALLNKPGVVVSRQELMDAAWPGTFVTDSSLLEAIGLLREVFGDNPRKPAYIQTVHRRGYRFIGLSTEAQRATPPFFSGPEWRPIVAACVTYAVTTVCVAIVFALFGQPRVERRIEAVAAPALAIPSWTAGGLEIAFAFSKAGPFTLTGTGHQFPTSLSRDGVRLVFTEYNPLTGADIWLFDRRTGARHVLVRTMSDETWARLSPDGRQIAYMSNESGRWEVYVRSTSGGDAARRVSNNGGAWPSWSNDGGVHFSERIHGRPELRVVLDWFSELASNVRPS
jgi:DNA-binding winged helix-turn-helix (wHTH) protein